ncbi:MAG TPA: hypothetical protein DCK83_14180 [Gallionellaceae bacterium]|nr:hypothetical protein [Gallionellaceae bacterium]
MVVLTACQPDSPAPQATQPAPVVAPPTPVAAAPASAAAAPVSKELQLAQASKCFACHAIDRKLVGPAWKDIAAKYRGQKGTEAKLIDKVAKGGSGAWGAVPMPPNTPQVSQSDIQTLVRYILSLK